MRATREARAETEQLLRDTSRTAVQHAPRRLQILISTFCDFSKHADGVHAGAMAFFGTLSLFPLVLLTIVLFSRLMHLDAATKLVFSQLGALLPDAGPVTGTTGTTLNIEPAAVGVSLFALLWSSLGVFVTLGYSLDRAWDRKGDRNIVLRYLVAAVLSLGVGATAIAASLLTSATESRGAASGAVYWITESVIVWAAIILLYRFVPDARVGWSDTWLPAAVVTIVCIIARFGFRWYLGSIAHIDRIYGPMASVAGLMLWLLVSSAVLLWGAELSHQISLSKAQTPGEHPFDVPARL